MAGEARRGTATRGLAGEARQGQERHGEAGVVLHGMVRCCMARQAGLGTVGRVRAG